LTIQPLIEALDDAKERAAGMRPAFDDFAGGVKFTEDKIVTLENALISLNTEFDAIKEDIAIPFKGFGGKLQWKIAVKEQQKAYTDLTRSIRLIIERYRLCISGTRRNTLYAYSNSP